MINNELWGCCKRRRGTDVKIIFMGDAAQLPPVNDFARVLPSQQPLLLTQIVRYVAEK